MKKYKNDCHFHIVNSSLIIFLSALPGMLIWTFFNSNEKKFAVLSDFFFGFCFLLLFETVIVSAIYIHSKHQVYIDEKSITIKRNQNLTENMKFEDVFYILFDHGRPQGYRSWIPFSITLLDSNYRK